MAKCGIVPPSYARSRPSVSGSVRPEHEQSPADMADAVAPSLAASLGRTRLVPIADGLAVAVAVSLPWSSSATSILIVLWLIAVLPTLDVASVRREGMTPAGG